MNGCTVIHRARIVNPGDSWCIRVYRGDSYPVGVGDGVREICLATETFFLRAS